MTGNPDSSENSSNNGTSDENFVTGIAQNVTSPHLSSKAPVKKNKTKFSQKKNLNNVQNPNNRTRRKVLQGRNLMKMYRDSDQ